MFQTVPLSTRNFSLYTQQWYMSYRFAVCTVKNSRWWTEELSQTCGVLFQKWIWEKSTSSWLYYKKAKTTWRNDAHLLPWKMEAVRPSEMSKQSTQLVYKPDRQPKFAKQLLWKPQTFGLQELKVSIVRIFTLKMAAAGSYSPDYTPSIWQPHISFMTRKAVLKSCTSHLCQ